MSSSSETEDKITKAFLDLLDKKPADSISVKEIAEKEGSQCISICGKIFYRRVITIIYDFLILIQIIRIYHIDSVH